MPDFEGKVALVTGASRGIGRAIAVALAQQGASVVVTGRATDDNPHQRVTGTIDGTLRAIQESGGKALAIPADLTSDAEIERLARQAESALGGVDILVNNAAANFPMPLLDLPMRRFDITMGVEIRAPVLLCKLLVPGMIERRRGQVLNLTGQPRTPYTGEADTTGRHRARPMLAHFTAKAALDHFTWSFAAEVHEQGVAVNCLRINLSVLTEGWDVNFPGRTADRATAEKPEVVAEAALWILRQPPSYTGANIEISQMRERFGIPKRQLWSEAAEIR